MGDGLERSGFIQLHESFREQIGVLEILINCRPVLSWSFPCLGNEPYTFIEPLRYESPSVHQRVDYEVPDRLYQLHCRHCQANVSLRTFSVKQDLLGDNHLEYLRYNNQR